MTDPDIEETFAGLGAVMIRRMFGGKGIYHAGLIIAVDLGFGLLLKADAISAPRFEAAGATRWAYENRKGTRVNMPYWSLPEEALDDPDAMSHWAKRAYDAALRSSAAPLHQPARAARTRKGSRSAET